MTAHSVWRSRMAAKLGLVHVRGFVKPSDAAAVIHMLDDAEDMLRDAERNKVATDTDNR